MYLRQLLTLLILFGLLTRLQGRPSEAENPLYVEPTSTDFSDNPALLDRIISNPHGYFRFINYYFAQEVCKRFSDTLPGAPTLNLHGDPHIEQYAVTDLGRGLTDFDYSCTGPAVLDLMRFGVSAHLACRANNWNEEVATQIVATFLKAYRDALSEPEMHAPEPEIVASIKQEFKDDKKSYFEWVESLMLPIEAEEEVNLRRELRYYIEAMLIENPDLSPGYFEVRNMGYLRMGIGSALDQKYLVRLEGPSRNPLDDRVVEIKEVRDLSEIDCITSTQKNDPFRILVGHARIAYEPYDFLGHIQFQEKAFWIHGWVQNYAEIDIRKSFENPHQLIEVAYDIGVQLGIGHAKHIADPLDLQVRRAEHYLVAKMSDRIIMTCKEMSDEIVQAWQMFRLKFGEN